MEKRKCLIIKTIPTDKEKQKIVKSSFVFQTEIGVYEKALPKIESILRQHDDKTTLGAK